ncbi:DUF2878 domain-containing protein [Pseudoalteromonas tunicata]|uniref:DUF2878 domain-containing protein n=1 Tax=Pseudoalteromonas tunicata TaxID=314281 RepID=UPI0027400FB5|nr:DUF2878 domain-containing protein [Pseudoalteromonas tunicata]MDP4984793.1 DUF2878 domain-containing protein [Pseudoalteromonas tunicata]MDP5214160.1 DUF2878 domain-containing protein [Pseudoalteromonas tunicata]
MSRFSIINLVFFQAAWFLAAWYTDAAAAFLLLLLCCHFVLSPTKRIDLKVLYGAILGITTDQVLISTSVFGTDSSLIPIWLILLWGCFAVSLNHSLAWLQQLSLTKVAIIGAFAGPSSYFAALKLEALTTTLNQGHFLILLALVWAALLPALVSISKHSTMNEQHVKVTP